VARELMVPDHLQATIAHAVKVTSLRQLAREIGLGAVLAAVTDAIGGSTEYEKTPRELAAAGSHAFRNQVVEEIKRYDEAGRSRDAVSLLADKYAADKNDPVEMASLKRKFRDWRGAEKRRTLRLPAPR
jgi:hypothetical protein